MVRGALRVQRFATLSDGWYTADGEHFVRPSDHRAVRADLVLGVPFTRPGTRGEGDGR